MLRKKEIFNNNLIYSKRKNDFFTKDKVNAKSKRNISKELLLVEKLRLNNDTKILTYIITLKKQLNLLIISQSRLKYSLLLFPNSSNAFGGFWSKNIMLNIFGLNSPGAFGELWSNNNKEYKE